MNTVSNHPTFSKPLPSLLLLRFPPLENAMFQDLIPSVISEFSAVQEKLAVWLVVVIELLQVWNFLTIICSSGRNCCSYGIFCLLLCFLGFACLFFSLGERGGGGGGGGGSTCLNSCSPMCQKSSTHLPFLVI